MMLLSSIIQTFETEFLATYQNALLPSQRKALAVLKQCRTTQSPVLLAQNIFPYARQRLYAQNFST
ncbi:MAG: hypothetical protein QX199_17505 [Methylococcaceae bacterium]